MKYFASTSSDLDALSAHPGVGVMTGPRTGGLGSVRTGRAWASDCDALSKNGYHHGAYLQHLTRLQRFHDTCAFVVVPDVPGDAEATLTTYWHAAPALASDGFPLAYCLQDGAQDLEFPPCDVAFLGGTDDWREAHGAWLLERAREAGLRTHVGRVNSLRRVQHLAFCHTDSCDGTYVAFQGVAQGVADIGLWLEAAAAPRLFGPDAIRALQLTEDRVRTLRAARRQQRRAARADVSTMPDLFSTAPLPHLPWADDEAAVITRKAS